MKLYRSIFYKDIHTLGASSYCLMYLPLVLVIYLMLCDTFSLYKLFICCVINLELPLSILWQDKYQQSIKCYKSLIYPRSVTVNAKFILMYLNGIIFTVLSETFSVISHALRGEALFGPENLMILSVTSLTVCIFSVALLFMFLGHRIASLMTACGLAGFFGGFYNSFFETEDYLTTEKVNSSFALSGSFYLKFAAVSMIIAIGLWILTLVVYRKRDI